MILSFIIPCYRSEKTVKDVIDEIIQQVNTKVGYDYEIIAINDCSPDNVYSVLTELAVKDKKIKVINFAKNVGKHGALMAGFSYVTGEYVVCVDDDGQCPIDHLWELIERLDSGADVAIARYSKKKQSGLKNLGSKVNNLMTRILLDKPKDCVFSNFIARKKFVCKEIIKYENPYPYIEGLTLRTTNNIAFVPMEERCRVSGTSGYTLKKSLKLWLNGFTAFSVKPLRISSLVGVLCALLGVFYGVFTILRKLLDPNIMAGYSSLVAIVLFVGGLIMMMLGMIGEYVGRIYICINNSPQYVIRETINIEKNNTEEKEDSICVC